MYNYFKSLSTQNLLTTQLPVLIVSLLFADTFYHFHSFLLEAIAFLGTWFLADSVVNTLTTKRKEE